MMTMMMIITHDDNCDNVLSNSDTFSLVREVTGVNVNMRVNLLMMMMMMIMNYDVE